jgi:hypothetical protein
MFVMVQFFKLLNLLYFYMHSGYFRYINLACIFKSSEVAFKLATSFVVTRLVRCSKATWGINSFFILQIILIFYLLVS